MAVVRVIGRSQWLAVWRSDADAARGLVQPLPEQPGAIRFDAEACEGASRLLLPLDALLREAAQTGAGQAVLELTLTAERVAERRPVEGVALLHGATARSLTFLKRLESLPVFGTRPRQRSWIVPLAELGAYQGRLFFALQFLPQAPACIVTLRLSCHTAEAVPAPSAAAEPEAEPQAATEPPKDEPPKCEPPPPAPESSPSPAPAAGGRADRLRALPDGAWLLFKTPADAKACRLTEEAEGTDAPPRIAIDLRACTGEVRLLRPLPELAPRLRALPEGLAMPLRLRLDLPAESRPGLLWAALTQGSSLFDLTLHSWIAKRIATAPAAQWEATLATPVAEGAMLHLTLQFAPGAGVVRLGRSEISLGDHLGAIEARDGAAGILARLAPGTRAAALALRRGTIQLTPPPPRPSRKRCPMARSGSAWNPRGSTAPWPRPGWRMGRPLRCCCCPGRGWWVGAASPGGCPRSPACWRRPRPHASAAGPRNRGPAGARWRSSCWSTACPS
jgi:hypothetical protein